MIIQNGTVFEKDGTFSHRDIYTDGNVILKEALAGDRDLVDAQGLYVIPGLVDVHIHGAVGGDFCDGDPEVLESIASFLCSQGVTSFCPTSMTYPEEKLSKIFASILALPGKDKGSQDKTGLSRIAGINMEGSFIAQSKKGAQNPDYIMDPDISMFERLQEVCGNQIRLITIAPEAKGAIDFIEHFTRRKDPVHISLGHTACDYDQAMEAFMAGADHVTHLYNAMHPYLHRAPGILGAAADYPRSPGHSHQVYTELICDGIHVHPSAIRNSFRLLGRDQMVIISDTLRACGLPDGVSELGGQTVYKKGAEARLADGTLAGSITTAADGFRNVVSYGVPLEDALLACTVNPAKSIGLEDKIGAITPGAYADLILMDKDLNFRKIFLSRNRGL